MLLRTVLGGSNESLVSRTVKALGSLPLPGATVGISINWPWSWSGLLQAAPKKRTSHQKKRQRQLAGNNQQKPLRNLNRCPACGHVKRAHTLCMHCVQQIRSTWRNQEKVRLESTKDKSKYYDESKLSPQDAAFNYPSSISRPSQYQEKLADREEYVLRRPRSLEATAKTSKKKSLPLILRKPYKESE